MRKEDYRNGDEMVKGSETGRIQFRRNHSTGVYFPVVVIIGGPRSGQSEYVSRGWRRAEESADYDERPDYDEDSETTTERREVRKWLGKH